MGSGGSIELGYNPRNNYLYATVSDAETVVIDATRDQIVTSVPVGDLPLGIAFYPRDGNTCVANFQDGTVSAIDSAKNTVVSIIPTGAGAQWLAYDPRNGGLYITNSLDGTVSVISAQP